MAVPEERGRWTPAADCAHVVPAALFIALIPLQFSRRIRARSPRWHRWSGRLLLLVAIPVALSGLFFGVVIPYSGPKESFAIVPFAVLFLWSGVRGFLAIR